MKGHWNNFRYSSPQTKLFIFSVASMILLLIVTTIYSYTRLDRSRSFNKEQGRYPVQMTPSQK